MDYTICYGNPSVVASEVKLLLSDGWTLKGELIPWDSAGVAQVMILQKWNKKKPKAK